MKPLVRILVSVEQREITHQHLTKSDNSICSEASASSRQERKRLNTVVSEDDTDMAVQAALDKISQRLDTLATRTDVDQIKVEVNYLTQTFIEKLEKLEG